MQEILFFFFAVWTLAAAIAVVCCRRPIYAAFSFGLCAFGTAALCALVAAPFLAATMALVYGGTVGLLSATLFAALAVKSEAKRRVEFGAMALGILMFVLLGRYMVGYPESTQVQRLSVAPGDMLFGEYALALYMVVGLLLAATISIAALTRMVDSDRGE